MPLDGSARTRHYPSIGSAPFAMESSRSRTPGVSRASGATTLSQIREWDTTAQAEQHAATIAHRAAQPVAHDNDIAASITSIAALLYGVGFNETTIGGTGSDGEAGAALGPVPRRPPPTDPFPPGDPRHQQLEDVNWKLLTYEANFASYTRKLAVEPGEALLAEYAQLTADLAEIAAGYKTLGIPAALNYPDSDIQSIYRVDRSVLVHVLVGGFARDRKIADDILQEITNRIK